MYVQKVRACKCPAILCHTLPFYSSSDCLLFPVFTWHRSHSPLTQEDSTKSHPTTTGSHLCVALWAMEIYKLNKQFIWNLTLRNKYIMQKGQYNNENGRNTAINGLYEILSCRHTSGRVWSSGPYFRIMAKPCLDLGSIIGEEFIEHWSLLSWFTS